MYSPTLIFAFVCFILGFMFNSWAEWVTLDSNDAEATKSLVLASAISYAVSVVFMLLFLYR